MLLAIFAALWMSSRVATVNIYPTPGDATDPVVKDSPPTTATPSLPPPAQPKPPSRPPTATAGPKTSPASPVELPDIDALLARMAFGNIAFNVPEALNVEQAALIQLLLSATRTIEDLQHELTAPGARVGERVKISDRMEARLVGADFEITAITPETQAVSGVQNTEWKWEIKPKRTGRFALHLTLSALVTIDGQTTPRTIKTFDRDILIEITASQRVAAFIAANWQWLWATLLVPAAGWWWKRRRTGNSA